MHRTLVLILVGGIAGCGSNSSTPTSPSGDTPAPSGGGPVARLSVTVDGLTDADAVANVSDVAVDASASSGSGTLTFAIDFGDGTTASTPKASHTYSAPGSYRISATVRTAQGQSAADRTVAVATVQGAWFEAEYANTTRRVEVRRLTVTSQSERTMTGIYQVNGFADRTFSGTLGPGRTATISLAGGAALSGTLPARFGDASVPWPLLARGDGVDGETLAFRPIVGAPTGPPPDAVLRVSFETDDPEAWAPFDAVTPVRLDGSASHGTNLAYFLEYGDGVVATSPAAARTIDPPQGNSGFPSDSGGPLTARLTVVDGFGRSDVESQRYFMFGLGEAFDSWGDHSDIVSHQTLQFRFLGRHGTSYTGVAAANGSAERVPATAILSGPRNVHLEVPAWGAVFDGSIKMGPGNSAIMTVVESGRRFTNRVWHLERASDF